jgi:hypothetical protein
VNGSPSQANCTRWAKAGAQRRNCTGAKIGFAARPDPRPERSPVPQFPRDRRSRRRPPVGVSAWSGFSSRIKAVSSDTGYFPRRRRVGDVDVDAGQKLNCAASLEPSQTPWHYFGNHKRLAKERCEAILAMTQISLTFTAPPLLSPRTAKYVSALMRDGDEFDYCRWLQQVRGEEAQAKEHQETAVKIVPPKIDAPTNALNGREGSQCGKLRLCRGPLRSTSGTRITRRLEKIRDAWDAFQANRARDAVYGYLEAVFAIVRHYKTRRRAIKLLRHAFKFVQLRFDKNADPFSAVIRCTCDDAADNRTISKWARALRYVARCKVEKTRLRTFMKEVGGVNACADRYAEASNT